MRKGRAEGERGGGRKNKGRKINIKTFLMATYVVASRPPERRPMWHHPYFVPNVPHNVTPLQPYANLYVAPHICPYLLVVATSPLSTASRNFFSAKVRTPISWWGGRSGVSFCPLDSGALSSRFCMGVARVEPVRCSSVPSASAGSWSKLTCTENYLNFWLDFQKM